jgi:hypothetical protein
MKILRPMTLMVLFGSMACSGGQFMRQREGGIEVLSATYGLNCRAPRGNVTNHLANACNDLYSCRYVVDFKILGDPARGCPKSYEADYVCKSTNQIKSVSFPGEASGSTALLDCPRRGF